MTSPEGTPLTSEPQQDTGDIDPVTLYSATDVDMADCNTAATSLGAAFRQDMDAIWTGIFDRGRVVAVGDEAKLDPEGPITGRYLRAEDLRATHIYAAYLSTFTYRNVGPAASVATPLICDPDGWAETFLDAFGDDALDRLVIDPNENGRGESPTELRERYRALISEVIREHNSGIVQKSSTP